MERKEKTTQTQIKPKLFLSDVDGTLIERIPVIQKKDIAAIQKWKQQGNAFGLVTGRGKVFCESLMESVGMNADVYVVSNGAEVFYQDQCIYESLIDVDTTRSIFKELLPYLGQCYPFLTVEDGSHYFPIKAMGQEAFEWIKEIRADLKAFNDQDLFDYLETREIGCAKLSIYTQHIKNTRELLPIFKEKFPQVKVEKTSVDYIEIVNKETDKAAACKHFLELEKNQFSEVFYIGDGENDINVFRLLEHTYVMKQAHPMVKQEAKQEVEGLWQAIEERLDENV